MCQKIQWIIISHKVRCNAWSKKHMIELSKRTSLIAELQVNIEILVNFFELCNASVQIRAWWREDRRKERTNHSFAPGAKINRLPGWLSGKESTCQCRGSRFSPWVWKIPWRRKWHPSPVFLPEKSHGQRSLGCYNPWGGKESDTTSSLNNNYDKHFLRFHFILQKKKWHDFHNLPWNDRSFWFWHLYGSYNTILLFSVKQYFCIHLLIIQSKLKGVILLVSL